MEESKFHEPEEIFFHVRMVVHNGKFRGIRGALLQLASKHLAYRLRGTFGVVYGDTDATSSNAYISMYFRKESARKEFINGVRKTHKIPQVLRKCFPDYKPTFHVETSSCMLRDSQLSPITDLDLEQIHQDSPPGSIDYDCEVQSLGSYFGSGSRRSSFEDPSPKKSRSGASSSGQHSMSTRSSDPPKALGKDDPLFTWQTLEDNQIIGQPYRCHLIDKKYDGFRRKNDNNNFIAGSGPFHQLLDGLNLSTPHLVPGLKVEFDREDGSTVTAEEGTRHKVFVKISFLDEVNDKYMKDELRARLKTGIGCAIFDDKSARTYLHVLDVEEFRICLEAKQSKTQSAWRLYRAGRYAIPPS